MPPTPRRQSPGCHLGRLIECAQLIGVITANLWPDSQDKYICPAWAWVGDMSHTVLEMLIVEYICPVWAWVGDMSTCLTSSRPET